jgi:hypothetical protein
VKSLKNRGLSLKDMKYYGSTGVSTSQQGLPGFKQFSQEEGVNEHYTLHCTSQATIKHLVRNGLNPQFSVKFDKETYMCKNAYGHGVYL